MTRAIGMISVSTMIGFLAAAAAWVTALALVGRDEILTLSNTTIEFGSVIGATTAIILLVVLVIMHRFVEPVLTATAGIAGAVLLYNVRELPFPGNRASLTQAGNEYWAIVAAMIVIFTVLVVGLRTTRDNETRRF